MDRQLRSPLLIETVGRPSKLSPTDTFAHLQNFLQTLPPCPSRTQLERLTDALGVDVGLILPAEGERREAERAATKAAARAEKRRLKELQMDEEREAELQGLVEGLQGDDDDEEREGMDGMESGAAQMEGEDKMDDRGDVEYGDVEEDDDDEPDNQDDKMDEDDE